MKSSSARRPRSRLRRSRPLTANALRVSPIPSRSECWSRARCARRRETPRSDTPWCCSVCPQRKGVVRGGANSGYEAVAVMLNPCDHARERGWQDLGARKVQFLNDGRCLVACRSRRSKAIYGQGSRGNRLPPTLPCLKSRVEPCSGYQGCRLANCCPVRWRTANFRPRRSNISKVLISIGN